MITFAVVRTSCIGNKAGSGFTIASLAKLALVIAIFVPLISGACSAPNGEGFAIYLTQGDIPPSQLPAMSHVDLAEKPLIGMADIITYDAQTHELKLTADAFESISQLAVPVRGKSFVVCVDRKQIYSGAFWTPVSSMSFDGVTIWKPLGPDPPHIVTLELGYPSSSFYGGEDPRNTPEILDSLALSGKLITMLTISEISVLPASFKGYELYSWPENGRWNFTLITGTNRNKTFEEVTSGEDFISETGWERIHVVGVENIESVLGKLPKGEEVFWLSAMRDNSAQSGVKLQLPPNDIVSTLREYATQRELHLTVQTP